MFIFFSFKSITKAYFTTDAAAGFSQPKRFVSQGVALSCAKLSSSTADFPFESARALCRPISRSMDVPELSADTKDKKNFRLAQEYDRNDKTYIVIITEVTRGI